MVRSPGFFKKFLKFCTMPTFSLFVRSLKADENDNLVMKNKPSYLLELTTFTVLYLYVHFSLLVKHPPFLNTIILDF